MITRIGLISGTVFFHQDFFKEAEEKIIETDFGPAICMLTNRLAYVQRHRRGNGSYINPHDINHPANLSALKEIGVTEYVVTNNPLSGLDTQEEIDNMLAFLVESRK